MKSKQAEGNSAALVGAEVLVQDAMTREVISVRKLEDILDAANLMSENNVSGLPVVDREDRVIGIVSEADILSMIGLHRGHTFRDILKHILGEPLPERKMGDLVADIMASPAVTTRPDATLAEAARTMDELRIKRLPVTDSCGKLEGIISRADIVKAVSLKMR